MSSLALSPSFEYLCFGSDSDIHIRQILMSLVDPCTERVIARKCEAVNMLDSYML